MKRNILILYLVLLCAGMGFADEGANPSEILTESNVPTGAGSQIDINQSDAQFTLNNLIDLAQQKAPDLKNEINITAVASGDNASINLVLAPPGATLKMHYHKYRDEIAYIIKGQAVFNVSGKEYAIKAGDLMYIPSLIQHSVVATGNETLQVISTFAPAFDGKDRIFV